MATYLTKLRDIIGCFHKFEIKKISQSQNTNADNLANLAAAYETDLGRWVSIEILEQPNILKEKSMAIDNLETREGSVCYDPIIQYLVGWMIARKGGGKAPKVPSCLLHMAMDDYTTEDTIYHSSSAWRRMKLTTC